MHTIINNWETGETLLKYEHGITSAPTQYRFYGRLANMTQYAYV